MEDKKQIEGSSEMNIKDLTQIINMTEEDFVSWADQLGMQEGSGEYKELKRIVEDLKKEGKP